MEWDVVGLWILAYLTGSISSAVIVCRIMQLPDPRDFGSHNPGATNVLRLGGKKAALFTLLGDMLKAIIPILIGYALDLHNRNLGWVGFMAFIGHLYPLYFNFKGGKGMATYFGALVALSPLLLAFCDGDTLQAMTLLQHCPRRNNFLVSFRERRIRTKLVGP